MSWNAYLEDDRGHDDGDWNYTHNCNSMIEHVLGDAVALTGEPFWSKIARDAGNVSGMGQGSWWDLLDGKSGREGAELLDRIVKGLEADPELFRAMNPPNGWGDYDSLVKTLTEMRDAVPEWPTTWRVSG